MHLACRATRIVGTHALGMQCDTLVGACSEVAPRVPPSDASKAIWPRPPSRRYAGDHSGRKYDLGATRRVCLPARLTVSVWSVSVSVSVSVCAIPPAHSAPTPRCAPVHSPTGARTATHTVSRHHLHPHRLQLRDRACVRVRVLAGYISALQCDVLFL